MAKATAADIDKAVRAARRAYRRSWGQLSGTERAKYLFRISRILQERSRVRWRQDHGVGRGIRHLACIEEGLLRLFDEVRGTRPSRNRPPNAVPSSSNPNGGVKLA